MFIPKKEMGILLIVSVLILSSSVIAMNNVDEIEIDLTDISTPDLISTPEQNGYFITNEGQWSSEIKFISQTSFGHVAISQSGLLLNMVHDDSLYSNINNDDSISDRYYASQGTIIEIEFMGSDFDMSKGMEELPSISNFIIGNDESKWKTDVKNYQIVFVSDIWDNIDFRLYFSGDLKYDFILRPGADINDIRMKYDGQNNIEVTDKEIIIIDYFGRSLIDGNLFTYYEDNGEEIDSRYICRGDSIISYELEKYHEDKVVIIDPMIYSTYLGGSSNDYTDDLIILDESNIIIFGDTFSNDFPTTAGVYGEDSYGSMDLYIMKYNHEKKQIVFSTYLGGSSYDYSRRIYIDESGNNIIIGNTLSDDFPTTDDSLNITWNGKNDITISILNPSCSILLYSTYYGGESDDVVKGGFYWNDSIYFCGYSKSPNFHVTDDAFQKSWIRGYDGFVSIFNVVDKNITYSTFIGGNGNDYIECIEADGEGIIIIGSTYSDDYPVSIDAFRLYDDQSLRDIVITKFNHNLSSILFSTYFGGSGYDKPYDMEFTFEREICIVGSTTSTDYFTTENGFDRSFNGLGDMFISILNISQPSITYSTYIGGDDYDSLWDISIDHGGILIAGNTSSSNFPITQGSFDTSFNGGGTYNSDVILMKFNSNCTSLLYSTFIGGSNSEWVKKMKVDNGNIHILGYSDSADFPTTPDSLSPNHNGGYDGIYFIFNIPDISSEPLSLQGTIADGQISLQWDEPLNDGGATILGYNIYRREDQNEFSLTAELVEETSYLDVWIVNGWKYSYYLTAVNVMGESNRSIIIDVVDIDKPELVSQSTPSYATTGDIIDIKVEFSDNVITSSVYLNYWFTEEPPTNVSINYDSSKWWEHSIIVPPDQQLNLNYYFVAMDPTGNWINTTTWSIEVIDNDPPVLLDLEYPSTLFAGGNYFFNATMKDNIGIFKVELFYRYNNGLWENITLDPYGNKLWSANLEVIDVIGKMEIYYKAWDASGNVNISDYFQIAIKDNTSPLLVNLSYPGYGFTGDTIQIYVESFDSIGINHVYCYYWIGEDEPNFEQMTFHQNYSTSITIPIDRIDILYFNITSEDISHNTISTTIYEINILDNILPMIDPISNIELDLGDILNISIEAQDNVGVANIYWTSNLASGSGSSINLIMAEAGDLIFNITIEDTSGNAVYHEFTVTVNDKIFDNDNDGIPDTIEMIHGLDPFDPDDAKLDLDTDGLSNILEYQLGTNISNKDTDMDGMPDGWEFNHSLYPMNYSAENDQDEDGKTDLQEYLDGTNPNVFNIEKVDDFSPNYLVIIGLILLVLIIIGAVVFVVIRFAKITKDEEAPQPEEDSTISSEERVGDEISPPDMNEELIPDQTYSEPQENPLTALQEELSGDYDHLPLDPTEQPLEPLVEGDPMPVDDVPPEDVPEPVQTSNIPNQESVS